MNFLFGILGVCLGALIGAIIEGMEGQPKMIAIIVFGSLTLFFGLIIGGIYIAKRLWPNREKWRASSSYPSELLENNPQRAIPENSSEQWRSAGEQEVDEWFEVDMGKERVINRIEFIPDDSDIEKPKKWRVMFFGEDKHKHKQTLGHNDGHYNIFVEGKDIPNRIRWFRVEIKEVAEDMPPSSKYFKHNKTTKVYWTISLIKVWGYRFSIFGRRFWEHEL